MDGYSISKGHARRLLLHEKQRILKELAMITQKLENANPTDAIDPEQILNEVDQEIKIENIAFLELEKCQEDGLPETDFADNLENLPTPSDSYSETNLPPLKRIKFQFEQQLPSTSNVTKLVDTNHKLTEGNAG